MLLFLLFIIISSCPAETLIRETWTLESGNHLLFRITDESALAELSIFQNQDDSWNPGVFILDTDTFQLGSLQASGLWRFSSMTTPVLQSVLRQKNGLVPNRTENSLQFPAAAFYLQEGEGIGGGGAGGGGMIQSREEMMQYSFWQSFNINLYSSFTLGFSQTCFEPSLEGDDEWFNTEHVPGNDFYFAVADYKTEFDRSSFQIMSAHSISEFMVPGFSVLPVYTLYSGPHDISIRYWLNSEHWVNRNIERPDWLRYGDFTARFRISEDLLFSAKVYEGDRTSVDQQGSSLELKRDTGYSVVTLEYNLERSYHEDQTDLFHSAEATVKKRTGDWNYSADAILEYEGDRISSWQTEGSVSRKHRPGMISTLSLSGTAEPGILDIKPLLEESWKLRGFQWRAAGGYIFGVQDTGGFSPESLILKIQLEWSPD